MSVSRHTLYAAGYMNVMISYGNPTYCSETGTHLLLSRKRSYEISGTILYEKIGDVSLPYLAAVSSSNCITNTAAVL